MKDTKSLSIKEYLAHKKSIKHFKLGFYSACRWVGLSILLGTIIGLIATGFLYTIKFLTDFRLEHIWMVAFLPLGGLLITLLYRGAGYEKDSGSNQIIEAVNNGTEVKLYLAPLIIVSTLITHAFGGSVGREGAALQFGGSISNFLGRKFRLSKDNIKILTMAGMAGAFSALFGTPIGAAVFAIEISSVGIMYYAALMPCFLTAFTAHYIAKLLGAQNGYIPYPVAYAPIEGPSSYLKIGILALACALVGIVFVILLHTTKDIMSKLFKNPYIRVVVGGVVVSGTTLLIGTQDYIGLGENMIHSAFVTGSFMFAFLIKMLSTSITLGSGYKGGEIVPALFIGATFGSAFAGIIGLPFGIATACGMVGVFCSVTNAPLATLILSLELFGSAGFNYYAIVVVITYLLSGYFSLYESQEISFSKYALHRHER